LDRIIEVALGVIVGVVVNLAVIPPLRHRQASRYVDSINRRMGEVLSDMAEQFSTSWDTDRAEAWFQETRSMSEELDSAWRTVRFARCINRRMGEVLSDMAEQFSTSWDTDRAEAWFQETRSMSEELDSAWRTVRFALESEKANPRTRL